MESSNIIYFYTSEKEKVKKEHTFLDNFHNAVFIGENSLSYLSAEHYFQSHKFENFELHEDFEDIFEEIR